MASMTERIVRRYLQAQTFQEEGAVVRKLESATFADGNGAFTITLYERTSPPTGSDSKVYRSYGLLTSISHFSLATETDVPLGNSHVVRWLKEALARVEPLVQTHGDTDWSLDFVGKPEVHFQNGEDVYEPPVMSSGSTADSDS